jgi:integrase
VTSTEHLKKRGHTWYVRVQIPPHLWGAAGGRREFVRTLKTRDVHEANRLKHSHVTEFKRRIVALERERADPFAETRAAALAFRDAIERGRDRIVAEGPFGEVETLADDFESQAAEQARELLEAEGEEVADRFFRLATGTGALLKELVEPWLDERKDTVTGQTLSQDRAVLRAFLRWAGEDVSVLEITRKKSGAFIAKLLEPQSKITRKTVNRYRSTLSELWKWLIARGHAGEDNNPWLGHSLGKKSTRGKEQQGRRHWSDADIQKLLSGTYTARYQQVLHDLIRLACVTGARLDELCALRTSDIDKRKDGWWMTIREGKTKAAVRTVPIHSAAAHVFERRRKSEDGYVFAGLQAGGPDEKRGWNVSKAFTHYRRKIGLNAQDQVFHSFRNTCIEALEAAAVPESTVKLIVGHARQSMTFGRYSKGVRIDLRKVIEKLRYSPDVMRLIRSTKRSSETKAQGKRTHHYGKVAH